MITQICEADSCCGCMACVNICPLKCIDMRNNERGEEIPCIDAEKCISCNLCKKVCPQNGENETHNVQDVFAAWSNREEIRRLSASGGIASEIYRISAADKYYVGCCFDSKHRCSYNLTHGENDALNFQNSKYVYSYMGQIYKEIAALLKEGKDLVFVGLPCHAAGLKKYLRLTSANMDKLTVIDLICHGVVPHIYLDEWVKRKEKRFNKKSVRLQFRNPNYETKNYVFTLEDQKGEFYRRFVWQMDSYHYSYHHALDYRESCYHCKFANAKRVSDMTLGDFPGLGEIEPFELEKDNVSCVMINSQKGAKLFEEMLAKGFITAVKRPKEEALLYERQLREPSTPHSRRDVFVEKYVKTQSFSASAAKALWPDKVKYYIRICCGFYLVKALIPNTIKEKLRRTLVKR